MFTGLVVETGEIIAVEHADGSARLTLRAQVCGPKATLGDSVAVNGCCLTVTTRDGDRLSFDLLAETLAKTNLGSLAPGTQVNLEPSLELGAKLGGHYVQGHVDTTAEILDFSAQGQDHRLEVALPDAFQQYVANKGSIAVDGISLTVAEVREHSFVCWIIPHTLQLTNLSSRRTGDGVNLEFDILAKQVASYVERILSLRK